MNVFVSVSKFLYFWPSTTRSLPHRISSDTVDRPDSIDAIAVTGLNVEPGG